MNKHLIKSLSCWRLFGMLLCTGILLSGCSVNDIDGIDPVSSDGYLQLNLSKSETRTNLDETGAGTFSEGDRVGLYIDNDDDFFYQELTYTNGGWLPRLKRADFGPGRLVLSAHYPVAPGASDLVLDQYEFKVAADQSGAGRDASDLIVAQSVVEENQYRADLNFRHALHRLRIELTSEEESNTDILVRSRIGGVVDLLTGEATVTDDTFEWIKPAKCKDGSFEAVIYPQSAAPYRDGDGSLLKLTVQGKEYAFKAPEKQTDGTVLNTFEAGKQLTVKVSLKQSGDQEWANKKAWVYGITPPAEGEWKHLFPEISSIYYLAWNDSRGWYDCNKQNPSALPGGIPDGRMCWAGTASNLLHWWIAQNKTYIDMYGDKYQGPDYRYPLPKDQESDIFQCFIDAYEDEAGFADAGVKWFIQGIIPTLPYREYPYNDGGYFKDVFPKEVKICNMITGLSKARFNETIKDALSNKKAIGMVEGVVTKSHSVSIWGAEFDENGDVAYIYVADNNDRNQFEYWNVGCIRYPVVYDEDGLFTYYQTGVFAYNQKIVISRLETLELGEEYWKQYFGF